MLTSNADLSITPVFSEPQANHYALVFQKDQLLLDGSESEPRLATYARLKPLLPEGARLMQLARSGDAVVFCPDPAQDLVIPEGEGLCYRNVRMFQRMQEPQSSLITAGYHLWNWYRNNRFCGRCGSPLSPSHTERALACAKCGNLVFPMIAPAVIVAVTKGDRLLLAQNLHYATRHHTLIAGYVEVGETLEHAVRREVMEEVGLRLKDVRYLGDQPWGLSGSQMFGFQAEVEGDDPIRLQEDELCSAQWYARADLPMDIGKGSIAYALIARFRDGTL